MATMLIEAAVDSAADAERALREGADRLEVCSALYAGGLTPSLELLRSCLALGVPCVAMARPRAGDFTYDETELAELEAVTALLRDAGAHGVVFGMLTPNRTIDADALRRAVRLCAGIETVFHRAFDRTVNVFEALDVLIDCGVTRVLTSGGAATASEGVDALLALIVRAAGRIEILPGGNIRSSGVLELVRRTGAMQIHARGTEAGTIAEIRAALA